MANDKYRNISETTDELNSLAVGIAHEIKNPLSSIQTNSANIESIMRDVQDVLEDYLDENPDLQIANFSPQEAFIRLYRCIQGIKSSAVRIGGVIDNFNEFAGRGEMKTAKLNLEDIIDETRAMLEVIVEKVGELEVKWEIEPPVFIDGNRLQLYQALNNLIKNAVDALEDKLNEEKEFDPRIKLIITRSEDYLQIIVDDNGPGIEDNLKKKIFMPFISTKRQGKGFGIGLAKVRGIVLRHNGRLFLQEKDEPGATFVMELPLLE